MVTSALVTHKALGIGRTLPNPPIPQTDGRPIDSISQLGGEAAGGDDPAFLRNGSRAQPLFVRFIAAHEVEMRATHRFRMPQGVEIVLPARLELRPMGLHAAQVDRQRRPIAKPDTAGQDRILVAQERYMHSLMRSWVERIVVRRRIRIGPWIVPHGDDSLHEELIERWVGKAAIDPPFLPSILVQGFDACQKLDRLFETGSHTIGTATRLHQLFGRLDRFLAARWDATHHGAPVARQIQQPTARALLSFDRSFAQIEQFLGERLHGGIVGPNAIEVEMVPARGGIGIQPSRHGPRSLIEGGRFAK